MAIDLTPRRHPVYPEGIDPDPSFGESANGWWWMERDYEWCAALIRLEVRYRKNDDIVEVTWLRPDGGMGREWFNPQDFARIKWGGRIPEPKTKA